jgi:hypothetical protein
MPMRTVRLIAVALLVATSCVEAPPAPAPTSCQLQNRTPSSGPHAVDAEDLRAIALPKGDLGADYSAFSFDWFFAGFETNEERARDKSVRPDQERKDLARFDRLAGYQEMYVPAGASAQASPVVRIFTLVHLFRDAAGASGYLTTQATYEASGAFDLPALGEQANGFRSTGSGGQYLTRVNVRRGQLMGTLGINRRDQVDVTGEAIALARKLDERMRRAMVGDLRGYTGPPNTEIGSERVQLMALPQADLGSAYSRFVEDVGSGGFHDNEERTRLASVDPASDLAEFDSCGRVTGYFNLFESTGGREFVNAGTHLFSQEAGARGFVARFFGRQKQLAGPTFSPLISDFAVAGIGDQAAGLLRKYPDMPRATVLARRGRVVGDVTFVIKDPQTAQSDAIALARKLDDRIAGVLSGRIRP